MTCLGVRQRNLLENNMTAWLPPRLVFFEIKGEWLAQQVRIVVELTPLLVLEYFDMSTLRLTEKIFANYLASVELHLLHNL